MFEDVDPLVVLDATTQPAGMNLTGWFWWIGRVGAVRPSLLGELELLLAQLLLNVELLCSVVSPLLQVSKAAAAWGNRSVKVPGSHDLTFHLGRALHGSGTLSVSRTEADRANRSSFPALHESCAENMF